MPISLTNGAFWADYYGNNSFTGTSVTVSQALKLSTVWACVRLISETLATLPLGFYKRNEDGSRTPATSHNLYNILHNQPNADQTAVVFWEAVVASLLLWGNAYIEVVRSGKTIIALHFLLPSQMTVKPRESGGYSYSYRDSPSGKERPIAEADLMHIPAFSTDGVFGLSPIAYGANVFGAAIETDKTSAETFRDGMRSPGIITMDMLLKPAQREEIRAHAKSAAANGDLMVLEKGTGFQKLGFDPESAELLASRSWNVEEMCRWYGVDPSMIGHGSKDSNWGTGLEQKMLWFITLTLRKWCVRVEQAVRKSLLTPVERLTYFAEFSLDGLLRGDSESRAAFYSVMTQNAIMTRDECRVKENLPRMGGNAAVLTAQSNMLPIDKLGQATPGSAAADALKAWLDLDVPAKEKS